MIVVLDASAAISIVLNNFSPKEAGATYSEALETADYVIAPDLYISEIANVAWKHYKFSKFSHEEAVSLAEDGIALIDQYVSTKEVWKEALRESINNDHPVYDAVYAICARRNDALLLTCDTRLQALCRKLAIAVI